MNYRLEAIFCGVALTIYNLLCIWLYFGLHSFPNSNGLHKESDKRIQDYYSSHSIIDTGIGILNVTYILGIFVSILYVLGMNKYQLDIPKSKQVKVIPYGTRLWSLAIGIVQTVICTASLAFLIFVSVITATTITGSHNDSSSVSTQSSEQVSAKDEEGFLSAMNVSRVSIARLILILRFFIGIIAGVYLILGVKQGDASKLSFWKKVELSFLPSTIVAIGTMEILPSNCLYIFINIFLILVVFAHQQELLNPLRKIEDTNPRQFKSNNKRRGHDILYKST